jgi:hypothetical protein
VRFSPAAGKHLVSGPTAEEFGCFGQACGSSVWWVVTHLENHGLEWSWRADHRPRVAALADPPNAPPRYARTGDHRSGAYL